MTESGEDIWKKFISNSMDRQFKSIEGLAVDLRQISDTVNKIKLDIAVSNATHDVTKYAKDLDDIRVKVDELYKYKIYSQGALGVMGVIITIMGIVVSIIR